MSARRSAGLRSRRERVPNGNWSDGAAGAGVPRSHSLMAGCFFLSWRRSPQRWAGWQLEFPSMFRQPMAWLCTTPARSYSRARALHTRSARSARASSQPPGQASHWLIAVAQLTAWRSSGAAPGHLRPLSSAWQGSTPWQGPGSTLSSVEAEQQGELADTCSLLKHHRRGDPALGAGVLEATPGFLRGELQGQSEFLAGSPRPAAAGLRSRRRSSPALA